MKKQNLLERAQFFFRRQWLNRSFSSKKYWDLRYKYNWNSGQGSYGESSKAKSKVFNQLLKDYSIESVIEFGCGDGHQLALYQIKNYLGLDVSKVTIDNIINLYQNDASKSFMWYDPESFKVSSHFINAQAAISVDVIFHLVEDPIFEKYMHDLFASANKNVFIYATNFFDEKMAVAHLRNRKFTDWVSQNIEGWALSEERETLSESGEKFLNWYVYSKEPSS